MPQLPRYGWLFKCEHCNMITSRITAVKHRRRTKPVYICLPCRHPFIHCLLGSFNTVIIQQETIAQQTLVVS